jgi:hypothetical protein
MELFSFEEFINESHNNTYSIGDVVLIRYYLTGDITPVKIIDKKSKNYFIVSHRVKDGHLYNAPDHGIKSNSIIGLYKSVGEPVDNTQRYTQDPAIRPDTSGIIPGWNSWNNDISF